MAKSKVLYVCVECGYVAPSYLGRCPECSHWNSFIEQHAAPKPKTDTTRNRNIMSGPTGALADLPRPLSEVISEEAAVFSSGLEELDRVLGGGILPGAYVLIGGDPGIGKSTLLLQVASQVGSSGKLVLYVAGEESPYQIKLRAERLGLNTAAISVLPTASIQTVLSAIAQCKPDLVIIDSIQSLYCPDVTGTPGSVSQIKECAAILMETAKTSNIPIFLIGHVTKEGNVSGPKLLEHTVDAVLYFEGDKYQNLRILRAVKNRFGNTQEIGVFEMSEQGLREIDNPSELFLSLNMLNGGVSHPGSVITATLEGSRPILVEIQALVGQSAYATPRRIANGIEFNRLHQIVAILERRLGLDFSRLDVYVNVVGGLRIDETAADLAIAVAIISSFRDLAVRSGLVITGELGLTGEVRPIRQSGSRLQEAARIGFSQMIMPRLDGNHSPDALGQLHCESVATLADAVRLCFEPKPYSPNPDIDSTYGLPSSVPVFEDIFE